MALIRLHKLGAEPTCWRVCLRRNGCRVILAASSRPALVSRAGTRCRSACGAKQPLNRARTLHVLSVNEPLHAMERSMYMCNYYAGQPCRGVCIGKNCLHSASWMNVMDSVYSFSNAS